MQFNNTVSIKIFNHIEHAAQNGVEFIQDADKNKYPFLFNLEESGKNLRNSLTIVDGKFIITERISPIYSIFVNLSVKFFPEFTSYIVLYSFVCDYLQIRSSELDSLRWGIWEYHPFI